VESLLLEPWEGLSGKHLFEVQNLFPKSYHYGAEFISKCSSSAHMHLDMDSYTTWSCRSPVIRGATAEDVEAEKEMIEMDAVRT
jgi:hypothetical protein